MWKLQTGKRVETGIKGSGLPKDYWKYMRKVLQKSGLFIPVRIQQDIDKLSNGSAKVVKTGKFPDFDGFRDELTKLSKKYRLWLFGERGLWLETEKSSCDNIKKNPTRYGLKPSSNPKSVQFLNYE